MFVKLSLSQDLTDTNLRVAFFPRSECTWISLVPGRPPPHCLVDIPDSVSSLCLRLLSGQLGLKQHDPRSAALPLSTSCVYIYCMCVWLWISICTRVLDMRGATFIRFSSKNGPTKRDLIYIWENIALLWHMLSLLAVVDFKKKYLQSSGCGRDVQSYEVA